jgi:hypothetical protein
VEAESERGAAAGKGCAGLGFEEQVDEKKKGDANPTKSIVID